MARKKTSTKKKRVVSRRPRTSKTTKRAKKKAAQQPPKISENRLKQILEAHRKWLESEGKEGKKADLTGANLRGAILMWANLQKANLYDANLQEAKLAGANLQEAKLGGANLRGAYLYGANLQKADLTRADLKGAHLTDVKGLSEATLQNANLDEVTGLLGSEFARADVTGTTLPKDIRDFKVLQVIEETSKNARKIFLSMLLGCVYSWLTIATTTDARLLTNSASSPLPIIGTEIPIAYFYWAAPFILIALYVYLHFYLQRLWDGLAGLPAIFPDGKRVDQRAYPWLLNSLVRQHVDLLKDRSLIAKSEELITIFLAWWVVPLTLVGFWLRYLHRHEWVGTWIHVGLLVASVAAAVIFYRSAARTLRGTEPQSFQWKTSWQDRRTYQCAGVVLVGIVLSALSLGAINGVRTTSENASEFDDRFIFTDVRTWVPWAFGQLDYSPFADLRETDVSLKPANYWELSAGYRNKSVQSAGLKESDLRYADAARAFLINADLRRAQLQVANLVEARLQGANLVEAQLGDADLGGADLREANLDSAELQGAVLVNAQLQGANLEFANLQGAHLLGVTAATASQIKQADNWQLAFYSDDLLKELGLPPDHNETLDRLAEMGKEKEKEKTATKP